MGFIFVSLLIHSRESFKFLLVPGKNLVDHLIIRNLVFLIFRISSLLQNILDLLFPLGLTTVEVVHTTLDKNLIHVLLLSCSGVDVFLDCVDTEEPQHFHFSLLADSVGSILGLRIHLRVPI